MDIVLTLPLDFLITVIFTVKLLIEWRWVNASVG
jgi:hypothetical protein